MEAWCSRPVELVSLASPARLSERTCNHIRATSFLKPPAHDRLRPLPPPIRPLPPLPFRYGKAVFCEVRGEVVICGLSDAPIPWPVGKRGLVVYGGLAKAVRRESAQAVAHWWGVTPQTVWVWRKALGVGPVTEGTRRLKHDYALEPGITAARARAQAKARDPARRAKIAAARRGKPRPRHVMEALIAANTGRHPSEETRRKMSETHKRQGTRPPDGARLWTEEENMLVRTLPRKEASERTGRTLIAVSKRRGQLGVPDGRRVPR
jgi:hypothetical protein